MRENYEEKGNVRRQDKVLRSEEWNDENNNNNNNNTDNNNNKTGGREGGGTEVNK